jgi:hypothetical protein
LTDVADRKRVTTGKPKTETPTALRAFEAYWEMGDGRTLTRLAEDQGYQLTLLKRWSSGHRWQERVKQRIEQDARYIRSEVRRRATTYRRRLMEAIENNTERLVEKLNEDPRALLAADAAGLDKLAKLYFQLAEEPLADRHEVTGAAGGPVQVEETGGKLSELVERLSRLAAGEPPQAAAEE